MRSRAGKVHLKTAPDKLKALGLLWDGPRSGRLDPLALFGNSRLMEIEVGPGKGTFLLRRAARRPEVNFLALEWSPVCAAYVADRALRANLANIRVLCADAACAFRLHLPDDCAWRVHIYFPDPWPKRKHSRRRLLGASFLRQAHRVLKPGGWLGIVTDHADYFEHIRRALASVRGFAPVPFASAESEEGLVGTNFERKFADAGKRIYALALLKY